MGEAYVTSRTPQQGQAAVAVMLFMAVLVVSALALYKSGKLTTSKMELQNAADAAAFSMTTVEARDLNFAAYMNRAIVANEVAIGQMVGLASWAFHFTSFADFMDTYDKFVLSPLTLGVSTPIITAITSVWRGIGNTAISILSVIANIGTVVLHNINKFYGLAEYGYHIVSVIFAIGVLDEMITQNGPPGTKVSDFGIISLIAHISTYGVLPDLPGQQFTTAYSPTKMMPVDEFKAGGYGRLAALIRDGRDPFTMARGWELRPPGFPIDITTPESPPFYVDLGIIAWEAKLWFHFDISLERKGGSELRIILPVSGNVNAQKFNWSAADATGLFFELGGGGSISVYVLPEPFRAKVFSGGLNIMIANGELVINVSFGEELSADPSDCEDANADQEALNNDSDPDNDAPLADCSGSAGSGMEILRMPFPTAAPFGAGFAQAGKVTNKLDKPKMTLSPIGPIEGEHYGEAAQNLLAWESPGPGPIPPVGVSYYPFYPQTDNRSRVNKSYAGLPHFVDTTGNDSFLGIGAPHLLIGLVQDEDDFDSTALAPEPAGRFSITEAMADSELAAISKAELYFSRPTDSMVPYFHRGDGQEEYGSAFNPYWQARLLDTTYPERVMAILIQGKEFFVNITLPDLSSIADDIMSLLPGSP